jgi:membrane protein YdbS with pleckstrin-like domain
MLPLTGRSTRFRRPWMLPVAAVALIAVHATILRYVLHHIALSAAVVASVIVIVLITHLGLLGSLLALFRRRSRP